MRIFWWLISGAGLLAVAAISVVLALHSGGNPGTALATTETPSATPTPRPEERAWQFEVTLSDQHALAGGDPVHVFAEASIHEPDVFAPGVISDVRYVIVDVSPELELVSPADVSVDDVLDGADWKLRAVRSRDATLEVRLRFTVTMCDTCKPSGVDLSVGRRIIKVRALAGDANCDLEANSIDAALILQLSASIIAELLCPEVADVDRNGFVNPLDATIILQFAAGLLDSLCIAPHTSPTCAFAILTS